MSLAVLYANLYPNLYPNPYPYPNPTTLQASPVGLPRVSCQLLLLLCGLALFLRASCETIATLLWPLFLRRHFGFGEREYSALLILATATSTLADAPSPRLHRRATALPGSLIRALETILRAACATACAQPAVQSPGDARTEHV